MPVSAERPSPRGVFLSEKRAEVDFDGESRGNTFYSRMGATDTEVRCRCRCPTDHSVDVGLSGRVCTTSQRENIHGAPHVYEIVPYVCMSCFFFCFGRRYDLRVQLDIHAVAGSQNGFDNSGQVGGGGLPAVFISPVPP